MRIRVRFFAALRDMTGYQMLNLEFPKKVSCAEVMAYLEGEFAGISSVLRSSAVAVNGEYRDPRALLGAGDELAVLPPVSGGAPTGPVGGSPIPSSVAAATCGRGGAPHRRHPLALPRVTE